MAERNAGALRLLRNGYLWKPSRTANAFFQCLDTKGDIVASYRATAMAISKDGELRIYPVWHRLLFFFVLGSPLTHRGSSQVNS